MKTKRFKDVLILGGYKVSPDQRKGHVPPHVCEIWESESTTELNKKCFSCVNDCKQPKTAKIIKCPNYIPETTTGKEETDCKNCFAGQGV